MNRESGSATIRAVAVITLIGFVALVGIHIARVLALRHTADAAADLAALAASRTADHGGDGCAAARRIAVDNGAVITTCRMDVAVATVSTRATVTYHAGPAWLLGHWSATSLARAAPVSYLPAGDGS